MVFWNSPLLLQAVILLLTPWMYCICCWISFMESGRIECLKSTPTNEKSLINFALVSAILTTLFLFWPAILVLVTSATVEPSRC